jgi:hypothetical protein
VGVGPISLDRTNQVKGTAITGHAQLTPSESESDPFFLLFARFLFMAFLVGLEILSDPLFFMTKNKETWI